MLSSACGDSTWSDWNASVWFQPKRFAVLLALLVVAAFPDVIFGGRTFFYRDFGIFGYPIAYHHRESFWNGEVPLWNPFNNCGVPFLAQWNTLALYPLSLFYLVFPLSWSLGVFCVLHLYLAGLGMYLLAQHWTGHRFAAAVAGIAFAFNGLTLSCLKWPNNIAALAWMPWVVLLVERGWRHGGRGLILAGLVGATQMLSGGPEIILLTWAVLAVLWLAELLKTVWPRPPQPVISRSVPFSGRLAVRFFAVIAAVAGLSAAQLLPFLDLLTHSQRGAAYSDASWAMPIWGWANFLLPLFRCFPSHQGVFAQPGQYWISSYYAGIGVIALATVALWPRPTWRAGLLTVTMLLSLVLSFGREGYLYDWLRELLPPLQIVRFPIKFVVVANFVLPILAAFGVARLGRPANSSDGQPPRESAGRGGSLEPEPAESARYPATMPTSLLSVGAMLLAIIGVILWFAHTFPLPTDHWTSTWQNGLSRGLFLMLILATLAALSSGEQRHSRSVLGAGLLVLLWLDALTHAPRLSPTIERWVYEPGLARKELHLSPEPQSGHARAMVSPFAEFKLNHLALTNAVEDLLYSRMALFANVNLLDRIPKVDGFYSLSLREENQIRSLLYATTNASWPSLESFLGVAHVSADDKPLHWNVRTNSLPFATAGLAPIFADDSAILRGLGDAAFNAARTVYLPLDAQGHASTGNAVKADVRLKQFSAHRIDLAVEATADTWLVLAQSYYQPWKVYIDGKASRLWRANLAFQAIATPAGRHEVRLVYEDTIFRIGVAVSVLTLLACSLVWFRATSARESQTSAAFPRINP